MLAGELRLKLDGEQRHLGPGDMALVPKGSPHTYLAESSSGALWLTITAHRDFENFIREMSRAAESDELPEKAGQPTPEAI